MDRQIHGFASPDFEPVRRVFEENFAHHGDPVRRCASTVMADRSLTSGEAGQADVTARPGTRIPSGIIFSATKALTGICALHLADRGLLDLDAPVAEYWPEFAANRKERVTVSDLLSHRAGLPGFSRLMTIADMKAWNPLVEDLAAQPAAWEPGTAHGYHAFTFGWLIGEVVRRISGLTPGRYLREKICEPLGLDIWFGLPLADRHRYARVEQNFHRVTGDDQGGYKDFLHDLNRLAPTRAKSPCLQWLGATMMRRGPLRAAAERSNIRLFGDMTAIENVMVGQYPLFKANWMDAVLSTSRERNEEKQAIEESRRLLKFVGLEGLGDHLARNLPYGAQRRLEIARAFWRTNRACSCWMNLLQV